MSETAGGVLNSENEIRWPTGKKTILARQQCLWLPFKIFRFFETTFARFFLKRISSFFHQIFIDRFSHKITFSKILIFQGCYVNSKEYRSVNRVNCKLIYQRILTTKPLEYKDLVGCTKDTKGRSIGQTPFTNYDNQTNQNSWL